MGGVSKVLALAIVVSVLASLRVELALQHSASASALALDASSEIRGTNVDNAVINTADADESGAESGGPVGYELFQYYEIYTTYENGQVNKTMIIYPNKIAVWDESNESWTPYILAVKENEIEVLSPVGLTTYSPLGIVRDNHNVSWMILDEGLNLQLSYRDVSFSQQNGVLEVAIEYDTSIGTVWFVEKYEKLKPVRSLLRVLPLQDNILSIQFVLENREEEILVNDEQLAAIVGDITYSWDNSVVVSQTGSLELTWENRNLQCGQTKEFDPEVSAPTNLGGHVEKMVEVSGSVEEPIEDIIHSTVIISPQFPTKAQVWTGGTLPGGEDVAEPTVSRGFLYFQIPEELKSDLNPQVNSATLALSWNAYSNTESSCVYFYKSSARPSGAAWGSTLFEQTDGDTIWNEYAPMPPGSSYFSHSISGAGSGTLQQDVKSYVASDYSGGTIGFKAKVSPEPFSIQTNKYRGAEYSSQSLIINYTPGTVYDIEGYIQDLNGNALQNVTVELAEQPTLSSTTDSSGHFKITNVPSGTYNLRAKYNGQYKNWLSTGTPKCPLGLVTSNQNLGNLKISVALIQPPTAPQNLQVSPGDMQATLAWQAPASDGGSPVSNYKIYRGTSSGGESYLTVVSSVLTYWDTGLTNGQTYYYKVSAVNVAGEGTLSNEASVEPSQGINITLTVEDAPKDTMVHEAPGAIVDIVGTVINEGNLSVNNVEVTLEVPNDLFVDPESVFVREHPWDDGVSTAWNEITTGKYHITVGQISSKEEKQVVWQFRIPESVPTQQVDLTAKASQPGAMAKEDTTALRVIKNVGAGCAIVVTNRRLLYAHYNSAEVNSMLNYLYEVSDGNRRGEMVSFIYYVDRYSTNARDWNQNISTADYNAGEDAVNVVANEVDDLIEGWANRINSGYGYLVIIGGDEVIPFYRVHFAGYSEEPYPSLDPVLNTYNNGYFLTDMKYADLDDSNWKQGSINLSPGRITGASAADMESLIRNGIQSPAQVNNAIVAIGWDRNIPARRDMPARFTGEKIIQLKSEKGLNILNDGDPGTESPVTFAVGGSSSWVGTHLTNLMQQDYCIWHYTWHADYDVFEAPGDPQNDWIDSALIATDPAITNAIQNNRPYFTTVGCHSGVVTDEDGVSWNPDPSDCLTWALVHDGASGYLAQLSYGWSPRVERIFEEYYDYLTSAFPTNTSPVGDSLNLALRTYTPGDGSWVTRDEVTLTEPILYGLPWMTIDPPLISQQPQDSGGNDFEVLVSDPQYVAPNTFKVTIGIDVNNFSVSQVNGFDLININGADEIYADYKPMLPKIKIPITLPKDAGNIELATVEDVSEFIGQYDILEVEPSTYEESGGSLIPCDPSIGLYPATPNWHNVSDLDTSKEVFVSSALAQYDAQTKETYLKRHITLELTYQTSTPIVITDFAPEREYASGEQDSSSIEVKNVSSDSLCNLHAALTVNGWRGDLVSESQSEVFGINPGAVSSVPVQWTAPSSGGTYTLTASIMRADCTVIANVTKRIYVFSGEILSFETPNAVKTGDDAEFRIEFRNNKQGPVTATGKVVIMSSYGAKVGEASTDPVGVPSGSTVWLSGALGTESLEEGNYSALATVSYDGEIVGPVSSGLVIDGAPPISSVDIFDSYWQNSPPFTITAQSSDMSGVEKVMLFYRYSSDNTNWSEWRLFGTDNEEPWSWEFDAPEGDGYYDFCSVATDAAGNVEGAQAVPAVIDNMVSWWKFEGDARDSWGNNDGTIHGPSFVPGRVGLALSFDGVNDYVDVGNDPSIQLTNNFTVELWVKRDAYQSSGIINGMINKLHTQSPVWYYYGWSIISFSDGRLGALLGNGGGAGKFLYIRTQNAYSLDWHHVVLVANANVWTMYVDGELAPCSYQLYGGPETTTPISYAINESGLPAHIGDEYAQCDSGSLGYFDGQLDEIRIYNRALSVTEVIQNYQSPSALLDLEADANVGVDTTPPVSYVCTISPYWQGVPPFTVTVQASDITSGVERVALWYRYSPNNSTWGSWTELGIDNEAPWSWTFNASDGDGYYEFYSVVVDVAGNTETAPTNADAACGVDTVKPESTAREISQYWRDEPTMMVIAQASDDRSGVASVALWYRYSPDNATWGDWREHETDSKWPWFWYFEAPDGDGYYEFYTIGVDQSRNVEEASEVADACMGIDRVPPESSVNPIQPCWQSGLTITATASDDRSGVNEVMLFYKHSSDNVSWSDWQFYGIDSGEPWSWEFSPDDDGCYQFGTLAVDRAGNLQPGAAESHDTLAGEFRGFHLWGPSGYSDWVWSEIEGDYITGISEDGAGELVVTVYVENMDTYVDSFAVLSEPEISYDYEDGHGGISFDDVALQSLGPAHWWNVVVDSVHGTAEVVDWDRWEEGEYEFWYSALYEGTAEANVRVIWPEATASVRVCNDTESPIIEHVPLAEWQGSGPYVVTANATDNLSGVNSDSLAVYYGTLGNVALYDDFGSNSLDTAEWSTGGWGVANENIATSDGRLELTASAAEGNTDYGANYVVSNSALDFDQGSVFDVQMSVPTDNAPADFRSEFYLTPTFTTSANPHDLQDWLRASASVDRDGVRWMLQRRVEGRGVGTLYTSGPTTKLSGTWRIVINGENVAVWLDNELVEPNAPHGLSFTIAHLYLCERTSVAPVYAVRFDSVVAGGLNWTRVGMHPTGNPGEYSSEIPDQPDGTTVWYYVYADDMTANVGTSPVGAPPNAHIFVVDKEPPIISGLKPANGSLTNNSTPTIEAIVYDEVSGIDPGALVLTVDGSSSTAAYDEFTGRALFVLSNALPDGAHVATLTVTDCVGNENTATWSFTVDTAPPTSRVEPIAPYWHSSLPIEVNAEASDGSNGISSVELRYRYSQDNASWGQWTRFGVKENAPWTWQFDAREGDGFYQFLSVATDTAGNEEVLEQVFADEFAGASLDAAAWSTGMTKVSSSGIAVSGGSLQLTSRAATSGTYGAIYAVSKSPSDFGAGLVFDVSMSVPTDNAPADFRSEFYLLPEFTASVNPNDRPNWLRVSASVDRNGVTWMLQRRVAGGGVGTLGENEETIESDNGELIDLLHMYTSGATHRLSGTWRIEINSENVTVWLDDNLVEPTRAHGLNFTNAYMYLVNRTKVAPVYTVAFDRVKISALEPAADARAGVDTAAPVTQHELSGTEGGASWWREVNVTLSAADALNGVDRTLCHVDGGAWQPYTGPFAVSGEGVHSVEYYSVDTLGNEEEAKSVEVKIDTMPPTTSSELSGIAGNDGWWRSDITVAFSAADNTDTTTDVSGVDYTEYQVDGGEWTGYAAPFATSGDGTHTVDYRSVDVAGNEEATKHVVIKIDTAPPVSSVDPVASYWQNASTVPFTVGATASDLLSGVENVELFYKYSADNATWDNWTSYGVDAGEPWFWSFTAPAGDGYYEFYSTAMDVAGNVETPPGRADLNLGVDTMPPTTSYQLFGISNSGWWVSDVNVALSATNNLSGVSQTLYRVDGEAWQAYESPFTVSGDGVHSVDYYSMDMAGNEETIKSVEVKVDATPPVSSVNPAESYWQNSTPFTVSATGSDALSGVASVGLHYRYSADNLVWGGWKSYGVGIETPWSWQFAAPEGDGYYEFYSAATDAAGNAEAIENAYVAVAGDGFSGASLDTATWSTGKVGVTLDNIGVSDGKLAMTARAAKSGTYGANYAVSNSTFDFSQGVMFEVQMGVPTDNTPADFRSEFYLTPTFTTTTNPHDQPNWLRVSACANRQGVTWMLQRRVAGGGVGTLGENEETIESDNGELIDLLHMYTSGSTHKLSGIWRIEINSENITVWLDDNLVEPTRPHGMSFTSAYAYLCERTNVAPVYTVTFDYVKMKVLEPAADASAGLDTAPPSITITSPLEGAQYIARRDNISVNFKVTDALDPSPIVSAYFADVEDGIRVDVIQGQSIEPLSIDDGFWTMTVEAADQAGNSSSLTTGQFEVIHDIQPPRTAITAGTPHYSGDRLYVTSATSFSITAADDLVEVGDGDGLGVALTEYLIDNGSWTAYGSPFTVSCEGTHTIYFRSTDVIGNVEEIKSLAVVVDDTPPESSVVAPYPYWGDTVPFAVSADASDAFSGVASVELYYRSSTDNASWTEWKPFGTDDAAPYGWQFTAPDGPAVYEFYSVATDMLGNVEGPPEHADASCGTTIPATVDIDPDTLNLKSNGRWITAYIELPSGYDLASVNISTITLNSVVPAEPRPTEIEDHDGIPGLMVKFDRSAVQALVSVGDVKLTVTGKWHAVLFSGSDNIRVINPGQEQGCDHDQGNGGQNQEGGHGNGSQENQGQCGDQGGSGGHGQDNQGDQGNGQGHENQGNQCDQGQSHGSPGGQGGQGPPQTPPGQNDQGNQGQGNQSGQGNGQGNSDQCNGNQGQENQGCQGNQSPENEHGSSGGQASDNQSPAGTPPEQGGSQDPSGQDNQAPSGQGSQTPQEQGGQSSGQGGQSSNQGDQGNQSQGQGNSGGNQGNGQGNGNQGNDNGNQGQGKGKNK